jgi:thiol-disulfide isomerase/thioredoxin
MADDGRAKMIVFLAHWCPYCQNEMPLVQAWLGTDPLPEGVDVYAVATLTRPDRDNFPPGPWFARNEWSAPVIVDDPFDSAAVAYGLAAVPYWVIVAADGTLVVRGTGGVPAEVLSEIATSIAP